MVRNSKVHPLTIDEKVFGSVTGRIKPSDRRRREKYLYERSLPNRIIQYIKSIHSGLIEIPTIRQEAYLSGMNLSNVKGLKVLKRRRDSVFVINYSSHSQLIKIKAILDYNNGSEFSHNLKRTSKHVEEFGNHIIIRGEEIKEIQPITSEFEEEGVSGGDGDGVSLRERNHSHIINCCPNSRYSIYNEYKRQYALTDHFITTTYMESMQKDAFLLGRDDSCANDDSNFGDNSLSTDDITFKTDDSGSTWYENNGIKIFVHYDRCPIEKSYGGQQQNDDDGGGQGDRFVGISEDELISIIEREIISSFDSTSLIDEKFIKEIIDRMSNVPYIKKRNVYIPKKKKLSKKQLKKKNKRKFIFTYGEESITDDEYEQCKHSNVLRRLINKKNK